MAVIGVGKCNWGCGAVSIDLGFLEEACARFDLGTIVASPVSVAGGLSNRLYRVTTNRGEFAVKRMVANATSASFKRNVEASFAIERLALAAGIAMPVPIPPVAGSDEALGKVADNDEPCWVRVHEWVSATRIDEDKIARGDIASLGAILAKLHRLPPPGPDHALGPDPQRPTSERDWRSALVNQSEAGPLIEAIAVLEDIVRVGHATPRSERVLSHRDLDAKNLLRDAGGALIVIDWDAAGPVDAEWDAVGVAMDWSGIRKGRKGYLSRWTFEAVLDAYVMAGGRLGPVGPASFTGWCEGVLDWLWFNVERMGSPDAIERGRGRSEVEATERFLPTAAAWITSRH